MVKKGIYIHEIKLENDMAIDFGKKFSSHFSAGYYYYYVGSALNNIEARLTRHLSNDKKTHWHIDYLLHFGKIIDIYIKETHEKEECIIAQKIAENLDEIPNFGSSDCKCPSHLFYSKNKDISFIKNDANLLKYTPLTKF